jgi:xylulokinase
MYTLGYDIGSSFIKSTIVDVERGTVVAKASYPDKELPINAPVAGWAEQDPESWWNGVKGVTALLAAQSNVLLQDIRAIGISYQMHGLVLVDKSGAPLRPSIIWCDSRATEIGRKAFSAIGEQICLNEMLNSPGNFTASKLAWVKNNEPAVYDKVYKMLLPGDYVALRLTGEFRTTISGLSEGILWNFPGAQIADRVLNHYQLRKDVVADLVPSIGLQGHVSASAASTLGL